MIRASLPSLAFQPKARCPPSHAGISAVNRFIQVDEISGGLVWI
jgi:hypothetical protein